MERSSNHVMLGIGTGAVDLSCGVGKDGCQNSAGTSSFHVVRGCFCFSNINHVLRKDCTSCMKCGGRLTVRMVRLWALLSHVVRYSSAWWNSGRCVGYLCTTKMNRFYNMMLYGYWYSVLMYCFVLCEHSIIPVILWFVTGACFEIWLYVQWVLLLARVSLSSWENSYHKPSWLSRSADYNYLENIEICDQKCWMWSSAGSLKVLMYKTRWKYIKRITLLLRSYVYISSSCW
jgi:hypothetical protein